MKTWSWYKIYRKLNIKLMKTWSWYKIYLKLNIQKHTKTMFSQERHFYNNFNNLYIFYYQTPSS